MYNPHLCVTIFESTWFHIPSLFDNVDLVLLGFSEEHIYINIFITVQHKKTPFGLPSIYCSLVLSAHIHLGIITILDLSRLPLSMLIASRCTRQTFLYVLQYGQYMRQHPK